jgi:thiol-disulfide isomerase/thioredoxin
MHRTLLALLASTVCLGCANAVNHGESATGQTVTITPPPTTAPTASTAVPATPPAAPSTTGTAAQAAAGPLKVGDPAPGLTPAKWIKGEPVEKLEKGKVYVVEFWATWCGPCKQSIPHLTELASKFKDITFIGQDVWEPDLSTVEPFVKEMGDKMEYHVALDDSEHGKMDQAWMAAAGQDGIPTAFVVDKETKIAWIGHPMELEPILTDVEAGTFDPQKAAEAKAKRDAAMGKLQEAMQAGNPDKVLALIDEFSASDPAMGKDLIGIKYETFLQKKDVPGAMVVAKQMIADDSDNADGLNALAWSMVDPEHPLDKPDLSLAEMAAIRANDLTKGTEPPILDTLAHVYAAEGEFDKAVAAEAMAVEKNTDPQAKDDLAKTLAGFKAQAAKK